MIAVLSPEYLAGIYASTEWAGVFVNDPQGASRRLVPVMVRKCQPDGLLKAIIYIDIVDQPEDVARSRLLGGLSVARNKPLTVPPFPGQEAAVPQQATEAPDIEPPPNQVSWQPLAGPVTVVWRTDTPARRAGGALIEVHLAPTTGLAPLGMRTMQRLGDALSRMARSYGLFTQNQAIDVERDLSSVTAFDGTGRSGAGLLVTDTGQRGGWVPLPHDTLGAVLDEADVVTRVAGLLRVLTDMDIAEPERVTVAVGIEPASMVMVGNAADVGHRTSASPSIFSREEVRWEPRDSVPFDEIRRNTEEISAELAARIVTVLDFA